MNLHTDNFPYVAPPTYTMVVSIRPVNAYICPESLGVRVLTAKPRTVYFLYIAEFVRSRPGGASWETSYVIEARGV